MEAPNDPFGGSKHPEWNHRRRASDSEEARKIQVMFINVRQCSSMFINGLPKCRTFALSEKISGERAKRAVPLLTFHF